MPNINDELKATGVAQVLVVLKAPVAAAASSSRTRGGLTLGEASAGAPSLAGMENYFQNSELSLNSHLARAGSVTASTTRSLTGGSRTRSIKEPPAVLHYPNLGLMLGTVSREGLAGLRADERVSKVTGAPQPRLIRPVRVAAATPPPQNTWGIDFLEVPKLWNQGLRGKGVRVAHLDTGADGEHPTLKNAFADFAEFDAFGMAVTPKPKPYDTADHGTHTAATIAGRTAQGRSVGVAPECLLSSAIVIEGGNVIARILGGMDWAVSQGVRILNMSLGIPFSPPMSEFDTILQILRARNVLPVIAVGNEGPGVSRPPGNHPEPISVGAIDKNAQVADFSCSQRFARPADPLVPDLVAPGVDIISARPGGGYQSMDGSSMATPHVAGLAALLFEAAPAATVAQVENAIYGSCTLANIPVERGNRGYPNAVRALAALTGVDLSGGATKAAAKKATTKAAAKSAKKSAATAAKKASKKSAKESGKKASKKAAGKKSSSKSGGKATKKGGYGRK